MDDSLFLSSVLSFPLFLSTNSGCEKVLFRLLSFLGSEILGFFGILPIILLEGRGGLF